jgi:FkbM family methyltransferase
MIPDFVYDWTPLFITLFNSRFVQKFSGTSNFFRTIQFWQKYTKEFEFRGKSVILKDLDWKFQIRDVDPFPLKLYLQERFNYKIYKVKDKIVIEIGGYKFVLPFPFGIYELLEVWRDKCYGNFDLTNEVVVDVGAFIGDSALYFASEGAKKVIGFEPATPLFKLALENVELNNCENTVEIRNVAVGEIDGVKPFMFDLGWPGLSSASMVNEGRKIEVYKTKVVSLKSIVEEVGHVGLLKMDCEGAEHEIVSHAYREGLLREIDTIAIEIHGSPSHILSLLKKADFKFLKFLHDQATDDYLLLASKHEK